MFLGTCFRCETKTGVERSLVIFKHTVDLCSATSMESSPRDLFNDMAEQRPILKNNQNTYYRRFSFTPETSIAFSKTSIVWVFRLGSSIRARLRQVDLG